MGTSTPEGKVKDDVKKVLRFLKQRKLAQWFMPSAAMFGKAGAHDFICCIRGRYVTIETKAKKVRPRDLQIDFGKEVIAAQGVCYVVYPANYKEVMREILDFALNGTPLKGHDFSIYDRKPKRRTRRTVSKPAANPSRNSDREVPEFQG